MTEFVFTDRYGGNPPSTLRVCGGECEGMGCYPDMDNWREKYGDDIDKVPFLKCPDCGGTGRVSWIRTILRIPRWVVKGIGFVITGPSMGATNTPLDYWIRLKVSFLPDLGFRRFM